MEKEPQDPLTEFPKVPMDIIDQLTKDYLEDPNEERTYGLVDALKEENPNLAKLIREGAGKGVYGDPELFVFGASFVYKALSVTFKRHGVKLPQVSEQTVEAWKAQWDEIYGRLPLNPLLDEIEEVNKTVEASYPMSPTRRHKQPDLINFLLSGPQEITTGGLLIYELVQRQFDSNNLSKFFPL